MSEPVEALTPRSNSGAVRCGLAGAAAAAAAVMSSS